MKWLLEAVDVTVRYGGVVANNRVTIRVGEGEFIGLIGANGAGKTSFVDAVTGFAPVSSGRVLLKGEDVTRIVPHQRAIAGMVRTFQAVELFEDLTVVDNLRAATERASWRNALRDLVARPRHAGGDDVAWALDLVGISDLASRLPDELSNGQRKLVGVARALASRPSVVVLDEPAAGLDATESEDLARVLRGLPAQGISVLMIDHDMALILAVCDRIYALDFGRVIAEGTADEIRHSEAVIRAYLGDAAEEITTLAASARENEL